MKYRYSFLITPLKLFIDCISIFLVVFFISDPNYYNTVFIVYVLSFWILSSIITKYYQIYRFTRFLRLISLSVKHYFMCILGFFTFFGIFKEGFIVHNQFLILTSILSTTFLLKIIFYYSLKWYRNFGKNFRKVVVIGVDDSSKNIISLFNNNKTLGYKYLGYFTNKVNNDKLGTIEDKG